MSDAFTWPPPPTTTIIPRKIASVPSVTTIGGMPSPAISAPLTSPKPRPIAKPRTAKASAGRPGWARATIAVSIPVRARLAATERSMPRVRITAIWASAIMNRKAVSFMVPARLSGVTNTGA